MALATESRWMMPCTLTLQPGEIPGLTEPKKWSFELPLCGEFKERRRAEIAPMVEKIENMIRSEGLGERGLGIAGYTQTAVGAASIALPDLDVMSLEMEAMVCFLLSLWYFDGIAERLLKENPSEEFKQQTWFTFCEIYDKLWTGKCTMDDMPELLPEFSAAYFLFQHGSSCIRQKVPDFADRHKWVQFQIDKYPKALKALVQPNFIKNISLESCQFLRNPEYGCVATAEFAFICCGVTVKPEIREHLLYELIVHLSGIVSVMGNDVMSCQKDLKDDMAVTFIQILAKREKIGLEEAVARSIVMLESIIGDIEEASKDLLEEYNNDPELAKALYIMKNTVNACLGYYALTDRYGENITAKPYKKTITM